MGGKEILRFSFPCHPFLCLHSKQESDEPPRDAKRCRAKTNAGVAEARAEMRQVLVKQAGSLFHSPPAPHGVYGSP
jgi:hypothetical protein